MTCPFEKQTKKRLGLKTQFMIEFLLPFAGSRKVLEKMLDSLFRATFNLVCFPMIIEIPKLTL